MKAHLSSSDITKRGKRVAQTSTLLRHISSVPSLMADKSAHLELRYYPDRQELERDIDAFASKCTTILVLHADESAFSELRHCPTGKEAVTGIDASL